jgi:ligand-binding sensor domain-containing protein/signal transduction histidine kinase/CheY-like chemotaxis protein
MLDHYLEGSLMSLAMKVAVGLMILLLCLAVNGWPSPFAKKFEHISAEQGLSHGAVYTIVQDARGFMWFGTEDGVNKYDGYQITVLRHDPSNPNSLSTSDMGKIHVDKPGIMWFATWGGGLNRYDPKTRSFKHFRHDPQDPHSLSQDRIECILRDTSGVLWLGTEKEGLNNLDETTGQFTCFRHNPKKPFSLSNNEVKALHQDKDGTLWVGTDHGLNRFDSDTETFAHYFHEPGNRSSLSSDRIRAIFQDSSGALWIGTRGGGLNRFDKKTGKFTAYKHTPRNPRGISDNSITQVVEDSYGSIWIGTYNGGLNHFDRSTETFTYFKYDSRDPRSLSHNRVEIIYEDRSRVLWIGTRGGGINKLDLKPTKFKNYAFDPHNSNSLPHPNVLAIIKGSEKKIIWIGTDGGGLTRIDLEKNQFIHFKYAPNSPGCLSNNRVRTLLVDKKGALWAGTYGGGLNRMFLPCSNTNSRCQFTYYKHNPGDPDSISSNRVNILFEDKEGDIWVGTDRGLDLITASQNQTRNVKFDHYKRNGDNSNRLSGDYVSTICQDHSGFIWIGTYNGLNRLDKQSGDLSAYKHNPEDPQSLSNNYIRTIYESTALWIGTDNGLNRFDRASVTFRRYTEKDGLPSNRISGILSDQEGNLWISTGRGLSRFNPAAGTFKNYDLSHGLKSHGFNRSACLRNRKGEMFFGSVGGLTVFSPDRLKDNPFIPPVVLTSFTKLNRKVVFDKPLWEVREIVLPYKESFISFEFSALDYTNPAKNRYAYRLKGIDRTWINSGVRRFASYSGLSPGQYEFHVKGSNSDGVWNEKGVNIKITIIPPFWVTWWFRAFAIFVIGLSVFIAYRIRIHHIEKRNKELREANVKLEEQIRKRRQAEEEKAFLEGQLRHVQKLETIGTLAGGIAHDFNNILGPILGYTEMALEETPQGHLTWKWLEEVLKGVNRAKELVQQILVFARRDKQVFKPVRIQIIIKEAFNLIRASFPTTVEIQQDIDADCEPVLADPTQVHQVCMNLCANAKDSMRGNSGILKLELKMVEVDVELAGRYANLKPGKYVRFTVSDTGHGMDPETMRRLFEPFFTTKAPGEGTGMGLSVVHGIVMAHGGEITVFSEMEKGTRFSVFLPVTKREIPEKPTEKQEAPKGTEHVMVVDDEESMVIMAGSMLEKLGYKVTVATQSPEALNMFEKKPMMYDLVITDQTMPHLIGTQLSKKMKSIRADLPIVIMTGFSESVDRKQIKEFGIAAYLAKPFDTYSLGILVRKVLDEALAKADTLELKKL